MKKFLTNFMLLVILLTTSVTLSSCSKDNDDDAPSVGNVVGTWVTSYTETEGSVTYTYTLTVNFDSKGTGYRKEVVKASTGAESSDMYTFHYTVANQSNGTMIVTMVDDDDNYIAVDHRHGLQL